MTGPHESQDPAGSRRPPARPVGLAVRSDHGSVAAEVAIAIPVLVAVLLLVGVLLARGVDARLRLDDAAHQAARAASLTRNPAAATLAARQAATAALSHAGVDCADPGVAVDTHDFTLATGDQRTLTATASSPIDTYRAVTP